MKSKLLTLALAVLTVWLPGSCSKFENELNVLGTNAINALMNTKADQGEDISALSTGNRTLEDKINKLKNYVDTELPNYATSEWTNATFAERLGERMSGCLLHGNPDGQENRRTLSTAEWKYLFKERKMMNRGPGYEDVMSGIKIEGVTFRGYVLFPDNFTRQSSWKTDYTTWDALNEAGIVFLPAAGERNDSDVSRVGECGIYSSSATGKSYAYCVSFDSNKVSPDGNRVHNVGFSVRLVTDAPAAN